MLGLDSLPVRAIVVIVVHVAMLGRILRRVRVVRRDLHGGLLAVVDVQSENIPAATIPNRL